MMACQMLMMPAPCRCCCRFDAAAAAIDEDADAATMLLLPLLMPYAADTLFDAAIFADASCRRAPPF